VKSLDRYSDAELLAATPEDPDAFAVFYRRHAEMVLGFVTRRAAPADVGDLVAEVFATALVHRRRYDPARGTAGAWLVGIASHKIADANRRGMVEVRMCRRLRIDRPTLEVTVTDGDLVGGELLDVLPEEQRRAVAARVFDDKSYAEIAVQEAVSSQVARKRVSRALSSLRSRFEEDQQ
jgi:RNA polymerase sigma factor (sigma-70 family)